MRKLLLFLLFPSIVWAECTTEEKTVYSYSTSFSDVSGSGFSDFDSACQAAGSGVVSYKNANPAYQYVSDTYSLMSASDYYGDCRILMTRNYCTESDGETTCYTASGIPSTAYVTSALESVESCDSCEVGNTINLTFNNVVETGLPPTTQCIGQCQYTQDSFYGSYQNSDGTYGDIFTYAGNGTQCTDTTGNTTTGSELPEGSTEVDQPPTSDGSERCLGDYYTDPTSGEIVCGTYGDSSGDSSGGDSGDGSTTDTGDGTDDTTDTGTDENLTDTGDPSGTGDSASGGTSTTVNAEGTDANGNKMSVKVDVDVDQGTASGGTTCKTAPTCSGNPVGCMAVYQQWKQRCSTNFGDVKADDFDNTDLDGQTEGVTDKIGELADSDSFGEAIGAPTLFDGFGGGCDIVLSYDFGGAYFDDGGEICGAGQYTRPIFEALLAGLTIIFLWRTWLTTRIWV
jgi:hypothetical protein